MAYRGIALDLTGPTLASIIGLTSENNEEQMI